MAQLVSIEPSYSANVVTDNESKKQITLAANSKENLISDYKTQLIEKLKYIKPDKQYHRQQDRHLQCKSEPALLRIFKRISDFLKNIKHQGSG